MSRFVLFAVVGLFLLLFAAFEVLHPLADILHQQAHLDCRHHTTPLHTDHSGEASARDSHDPYVLTWGNLRPPLECRALPHNPFTALPDPPFIALPSPVPIG